MNYFEKDDIYFNQIRHDLISYIPKSNKNKILEIGAGSGKTLSFLKKNGYCDYCEGYDLMNILDNSEYIDNFTFGNIEKDELNFQEDYFDFIICGDVLEHLIEPRKVVLKLKNYLKKGGKIIVSTPNFSEISVFKNLLIKEDFRYTESGIFDYTHLRFFCMINLTELLTFDDMKIVLKSYNMYTTPRRRMISKLTFGILDRFLAPQLLIITEKL